VSRLRQLARGLVRVLLFIPLCLIGPFRHRFRSQHPVLTRATLTLYWMAIALVLTYYLSPLTDFNLAVGAAMSIVILGLSFLTGASGQVSLGNGAFMGVGAYAVAIWANHHCDPPIILSLVIATVAGAGIGLIVGLPGTRLRGPYLAGLTIAFAVAFSSLLNVFNSWTGGDAPLNLPTLTPTPGFIVRLVGQGPTSLAAANMWLADVAILTTGVAFFFMANLFRSRTGRAMRLVRENDVAAELTGVSLPHARVVAFMVSAAYAGLGGGLTTIVLGSVEPTQFALGLSITILSLLVIGGIGTLSGALIGGLIFAYSQTWIDWLDAKTGINQTGNLGSNLKGIIFGLALILVMLLAPLGIAGAIKSLAARALPRRS
jgi:branched-chain amino acid transport system permease protein